MSQAVNERAPRKLLGAESSTTRTALMDATEELMHQEGYGAVTARRIAERAGLKHQLIYYYFETLDDLFLAVFRRGAEHNLERLAQALRSDRPLRALWEFIKDPRSTVFSAEFTAMATRLPQIRAEIAAYGERFRKMQTEALAAHFEDRGIAPRIPPVVVALLMTGMTSVLVREEALGVLSGHAELAQLMELYLRQFEETGDAPSAPFFRGSDPVS
jgi:AcrR family transcriptional regulator